MEIKKPIISLFKFIQSPYFLSKPSEKFHPLPIFLLLISSLLLELLFGYIFHNDTTFSFLGIKKNIMLNELRRFPFIIKFLLTVIAIPLFEEMTLRYPLDSYLGNFWIFFLSIGICAFALFPLHDKRAMQSIVLIGIIPAVIIYCIIEYSPKIKIRAIAFFTKNYGIFFYFFAISFGVAHLSNYAFSKNIIFLPIIVVLPQIILGFFLTYTRLKYGIISSIVMHSIHNIFFLTMALLFS